MNGMAMHIVSSFEHSTALELAISDLEEGGIEREQIIAVPLDRMGGQDRIFDTIHQSDGISLLDGAAVLGTVCSVLGATYGFVLPLGPILCGLIGLAGGMLAGFLLDLLVNRKKLKHRRKPAVRTEVVLIIRCHPSRAEHITQTLVRHGALGVGWLN
jgi:hypothetical protein